MLVQCWMFEHMKVNETDVFYIFRLESAAVLVILKCSHNFMQKNATEVRFWLSLVWCSGVLASCCRTKLAGVALVTGRVLSSYFDELS